MNVATSVPGGASPQVPWTNSREERKRRPYRNPLRKGRKYLRQLKRKERRALRNKHCPKPGASNDVGEHKEPVQGRETEDVSTNLQSVQEAVIEPKRGRKATIEVNHVFCPHKDCRGYGVLGPHPDHNIVGCGTYTTKGDEQRQLYKCQWCGKRFSETQGTVFFGLKTPSQTVYRALACLAEGTGIRATARIFEVDKDTIQCWLRRAGEHCEQVSTYLMRNLQVEQVQLDELWSFVFKKQRALSAWEKLHSDYGDTWIWTAVDPVHKLVLAFYVGDRKKEQAEGLLKKLKSVLAEGCKPLLTSDQLPHYAGAILKVFGRLVKPRRNGSRGRFPNPRPEPGEDLHYATVCKQRKGRRIVSVITKVVFGPVEAVSNRLKAMGMQINTSFVERMNLSLRHLVSRLRRRGLTFSKNREDLETHLHLSIAYYHFVRPHGSLRHRLAEPIPTKGDGSPKKWEQRTPAMSAGLTDHIWTMQELLTFRVPEAGTASA
jgi:IS1 family transposase/transposase-like protein